MTSRCAVMIVVAVALVAPPAAAGGDVSAARAAFEAADAAFRRGEHRAAALGYESAFRLAPNGTAAYNAALAWKSAGEPAREADALVLALSTPGLPDAKVKTATARLEHLRQTLAILSVEAPAGARVSVAHVESAPTPLRVHVSPGDVEVVAELRGGARQERRAAAAAGQTTIVKITEPVETPVREGGAPSGAQRTLGWVSLVAGGLAGGAAVGMGVGFLEAKATFDASGYQDEPAHALAVTLRTGAIAAGIAAGALAVTGLVLVLTAPSPEAAAGARPPVLAVSAGPSGVTLRGSF
jgi:hypothetical protein